MLPFWSPGSSVVHVQNFALFGTKVNGATFSQRLCSTRVRSKPRHTLELRLSVCVYYTGTEQVCRRCEPPVRIVIITVITITMQRSCGEACSWSEGAGALVSCDTRLLRPVGGAAPAQGPSPLWPGTATPIQRHGDDAAATLGLAHCTPSLYIHREREAELYSKFFFWAPVSSSFSFLPWGIHVRGPGRRWALERARLFRAVCVQEEGPTCRRCWVSAESFTFDLFFVRGY